MRGHQSSVPRRALILAAVLVTAILQSGCSSGPIISSYSVSGRVTDSQGDAGLNGVVLSFSGGFGTATTDASGYWTKSGLSGSVTITPSKQGWTFAPPTRSVSGAASDVDFQGTEIPVTYSVSGRVTDSQGDVGEVNVLIFLGGGFGTVKTNAAGYWSSGPILGNVTATPAKSGLVFTPQTTIVSQAASNVNFTSQPAPTTYSVSGRVTQSQGGAGLIGVSFTFTGGFGRTQTDSAGWWSKSRLYGFVTVTPSKLGWTFAPGSIALTGATTNANFSASPVTGGGAVGLSGSLFPTPGGDAQ
ncbi:MAG: hypothetical protein VB144_02145 [Clostridia bacterium]|nr:hypothetical protein [Clostridia bacterium]